MGSDKKKSLLTDWLYDLRGIDRLSNDDMKKTLGGTTNRNRNNDNDDGNISADVPL